MINKSEEIALLKNLIALLPDVGSKLSDLKERGSFYPFTPAGLPDNNKNLMTLLALSGPLYFILGSGNKIIHQNGYFYRISSKRNLVSQLIIAAEADSEAEIVISTYLDSYTIENTELDDLWIYHMILNKLRQMGFDLEYTHEPTLETTIENTNLHRVNRLIESLKNFLAVEALKDKFMDEYILLNILNLPKLQKEVQDQMLFKIFGDLAPSKLLVAYYKVYQKLPIDNT